MTTCSQHHGRGRISSALQRATLALICLLPGLSQADEPEQLGVIPGTIKNFMEYYQESIADIRDAGGQGGVSMPQWEYGPGPGPVTAIPDFAGSLLGEISFTPLYLLDVPTIPFEFRFYISQPEVPAIDRKVVGITEQEGFTDPHVPPLRWTADGRIGVESQVGGSLADPSPVKMYLLAPEKLDQPFVESPAGPNALVMDAFELPFSNIAGGRTGSVQHTNICDPFVKADGESRNPYSCGTDGKDDCYDVTLISAYVRLSNEVAGDQTPPKLDNWDRVMGTPLHIRVSNPKTPQAKIAEVTYGEPSFAPKRHGVLFETITPADGRLLIARRGFLPLVWQNQATGNTHLGSYDIVYGVAPPEAKPCDVTHWGDLYPITHAPYDPRINQRYEFAMQPFRDPGGAVIPDGVDIKGTYPWMDKEAKMFSMQVSPAKLFPSYAYDRNPQSRYPVRCVSETDCNLKDISDSDSSKDNMFVLVGAWTQGKMVLLDGMLNDVDFRLGGTDKHHSYLSLYRPGTGRAPDHTGEKRVGSTRGGTLPYPVKNHSGKLVGNYNPANLSMLDSVENRLNYLPNMKHSRFHDVVWNMSSGHSTVEFSFDDYLNPDGFIVSNMVAHMDHKNNDWYRMNYYDGWHQLTRSFNGQVRIQNSATALPDRWKIPTHGRVYNGRMEPVANGGVRGKGIWFNGGTTRIDYKVPEQPRDVSHYDWFYSLFIDPRFDDDKAERVLVRFPDGSHWVIKGRREVILYNRHRREVTRALLPQTAPDTGWTHLALLVGKAQDNTLQPALTLFANGFPFHQWHGTPYNSNLEESSFRPTTGTLRLGKQVPFGGKRAFRGWMDEFKVFAWQPNAETVCNFGHGTLVGLPDGYNGPWRDTAALYDNGAHQAITRELASYGQHTYSHYACFHDYSDDNKAHLFNIPGGVVSLREAINFPEGPLYHDAPRPDSSANQFCLSCHHDNAIRGLGLHALTLRDGLLAKEDRRRQPTQPPAKLFGNIPANWFPGAPDFAFDAGDQGVLVDEWILPSSANVAPQVFNLALADEQGQPWQALTANSSIELGQLPAGSQQVRANVNGLVRRVVFEWQGYSHYDDSAPFTLPVEYLPEGEYSLSVQAMLESGETAEKSFNLNVFY